MLGRCYICQPAVAEGNPFESPRAREFPLLPLQPFGYGEMIAETSRNLGYHPFPRPTAILSQSYDGRPACTYCGYCGSFGCWNDSKSSTLVSAIRHAEATGKLEIRPNSRVMKILSNDQGQITSVEYIDEKGDIQEQPAGVVFLSTTGFFKHGLGNNSGQLGKHYMSHAYVGIRGLFPGKRLNLWSGSNGQAVAMDDLNGDLFDHTDLGFICGAVLFASNGDLPIGKVRSVAPGTPTWGSAYKRWIHDNADSNGQIFAQVEPQPYEHNFLDLDPEVKAPLGVPVIRVTYQLGENEIKAATYTSGKIDEMLKAARRSW